MRAAPVTIPEALEAGVGIVRLAPAWVPRTFGRPGGRLRLHPDELRALGSHRGGIVERWLASTVVADNGNLAPPTEGLSRIVCVGGGESRWWYLRDAIADMGDRFLGATAMATHHGWQVLTKFFDYADGLPFHLHQDDAQAALVGRPGKPEAHFFPAEMNPHPGTFPMAFLGLDPGVTRADVRRCLERLSMGETRITELSLGYRLAVGTGWDIPPGILHAPGSLCTYEPQRASDVYAMLERVSGADVLTEDAVWKDIPAERRGDIDLLLDQIDWEGNTDRSFREHRFMAPIEIVPEADSADAGHVDRWVVYQSQDFAAKESRIRPGRSVTLCDVAAYGLVVTAGHGTIGVHDVATATSVRLGQLTSDELFVTHGAARVGVTYTNRSATDDLVVLRHFGAGDAGVPAEAITRVPI